MGAVLINFMILFDMPPRPSLNFLRMLFFFSFYIQGICGVYSSI